MCNSTGGGSFQAKLGLRNMTTQVNDIRFLRSDRAVAYPRYSYDGTKAVFGWSPMGGGDSDILYGTMNFNHAPVFTGTSAADIYADACIRIYRALSATDADGDPVTFSIASAPSGAHMTGANHFDWTPTADQVGDWYVVFRAKDNAGGVDNRVVLISVSNSNDYCNSPPCPPNHPNCLPESFDTPPLQLATPLVFDLGQNNPNPFAQETNITFSVPSAELVHIEIFDLLGRKIRTLADGSYAPGQYSIPWDHRNESGSAVHGGIYMYRMTAGTFRSQKKMLFVP
jgi:hypothetical protein